MSTGPHIHTHPLSGTPEERLHALLRACDRRGRTAILLQDNPDPDALACAAVLREILYARLGKRCTIGYGGICGRAENRAMIEVLKIPARHVSREEAARFDIVCLVDAQPGFGNNIVAAGRRVDVVIDHHLAPKRCRWHATFADIRPHYGAATTILHEYLLAAGVPIGRNLATAMFYGIQSDTQDLGRESGPADVRAYQDLFLQADKRKLARIQHAPLPKDYFRMFADSLQTCEIAGTTLVSFIPRCLNRDMIAEVADRLLRLEGITAAVCYGVCGDRVYLSARARSPRGNAAGRMHNALRGIGDGGGHLTMAGGQAPLNGHAEKCLAQIRARIFENFAPHHTPRPLLTPERAGTGLYCIQKKK
ncbi:MAG TPA: bifunctional oligoribonuclease/PAP phosphatase NrnA [Candidatus Hydrogenedentes bacterium]|nr:bifunctional oligoribonuclease/PAP phosphatase NrnA [Candidatus Hydrogenedentota bacterium]HRT20972.1 bifunctional oligoribonuclease/PAP phosphatase NrnA [Candidatus Hydrogenedentota bacterium]HRT65801.1 bifunctional oligoribonuclease/PAP phosphatase NrnA [Candidatus Hydrogenedentota bacterium]